MIKVAVIGMGYVGLPLALAFSDHFDVVGFDINKKRIDELSKGIDSNREADLSTSSSSSIHFTSDNDSLDDCTHYIIAVSTGLHQDDTPDLSDLLNASELIGSKITNGNSVIYESTVYPGCTEEVCIPILEKQSKLEAGGDFFVGYTPERMVPGDSSKDVSRITKIVSGYDQQSLNAVVKLYEKIISAPLHLTSSIKVAEAAKVLENTQRDLNISLMNEMSVILHKLGIDTQEVINAAATKWNFHPYRPGLVGGHCISVDPMYLIHKAKEAGHIPQVVAAGRKVNDYIPHFIARSVLQRILSRKTNPLNARILLLGITFKEDVSDVRNSRVVNLYQELIGYHLHVDIVDPIANADQVKKEFDLTLSEAPTGQYDAIILAVEHEAFTDINLVFLQKHSKGQPLLFDIKSRLSHLKSSDIEYWAL